MKPSSDLSESRSFSRASARPVSSGAPPSSPGPAGAASLAVVPLFPVVRDAGFGGVVVEEEEEDAAEHVVVVAVREELCDAFEGEDPAEGLHDNPQVSKHLRRTFHIV